MLKNKWQPNELTLPITVLVRCKLAHLMARRMVHTRVFYIWDKGRIVAGNENNTTSIAELPAEEEKMCVSFKGCPWWKFEFSLLTLRLRKSQYIVHLFYKFRFKFKSYLFFRMLFGLVSDPATCSKVIVENCAMKYGFFIPLGVFTLQSQDAYGWVKSQCKSHWVGHNLYLSWAWFCFNFIPQTLYCTLLLHVEIQTISHILCITGRRVKYQPHRHEVTCICQLLSTLILPS